ncbi:YwqJ-related putative deaminase [Frankia canadensis]|uniref:YwqJ-related putative deaminase n=1 Tax=Frankia canadensis TaxID=1836972 RepID=UPI00140318EA|nr:YwqJ-related putative deaminase [Frankia canadensis]
MQGYRDARQDGTIPKSRAAPVTSVLLDRRTGLLYEAVNRGKEVPDDLHPVLQSRLDELRATARARPDGYQYADGTRGGYPHFSTPGTHAEVQNTSRALHDREAMGYQVNVGSLDEMLVDNRFPYRPDSKSSAPCCPNCTAILGGETGVDSLPGKLPVDEWMRR